MPIARAAQWQVEGSMRLRQPRLPGHSSPVAALQLYVSKVQAGQQLPLQHRSGGPACGVRGRPCQQQ